MARVVACIALVVATAARAQDLQPAGTRHPTIIAEFAAPRTPWDDCSFVRKGLLAATATVPAGPRTSMTFDLPVLYGGYDTVLGCNRYFHVGLGNPSVSLNRDLFRAVTLSAVVRFPPPFGAAGGSGRTRGFLADVWRLESVEKGLWSAGLVADWHPAIVANVDFDVAVGADAWINPRPSDLIERMEVLGRYRLGVRFRLGAASVGGRLEGRYVFGGRAEYLEPGRLCTDRCVREPPRTLGDRTLLQAVYSASVRAGGMAPEVVLRIPIDRTLRNHSDFAVGIRCVFEVGADRDGPAR